MDQSAASCDYIKRPGLFQLSLVTSVAIRKHIKTSVYWETLLKSMGTFGDKRGHFGDKYSSAFSFVKLLLDTLVTSRHIASV